MNHTTLHSPLISAPELQSLMASGTPLVGLPLHPEQELNVDLAVRRMLEAGMTQAFIRQAMTEHIAALKLALAGLPKNPVDAADPGHAAHAAPARAQRPSTSSPCSRALARR